MRTPFKIEPQFGYYRLLDTEPKGAKKIVGSKKTEEILGNEIRDAMGELKTLSCIFEGYKKFNDIEFIHKAEEYLLVWASEYDPIPSKKGVQISLDQRYFSWVFIGVSDCWNLLTEQAKKSAVLLARKALLSEEAFWKNNTNHNNRYSYSILTCLTALNILEKNGDLGAEEKFRQLSENFYKQVRENVYDDGSTVDFRYRDSVHYQIFNQIAWEGARSFLNELEVKIPEDVVHKLDLALNFSLKFINGREIHLEFVNSIHKRDADIQGEKVGKPFDKNSYAARQLLYMTTYYR